MLNQQTLEKLHSMKLHGLADAFHAQLETTESSQLSFEESFALLVENTFFTFASGVTSMGHRDRLAPQMYYYLGPFGLGSEYTLAFANFGYAEVAFSNAPMASCHLVFAAASKPFS